ncbi:MAG: patatin-like phospholipase family protein [Clostridia bacterium]|jgi:NTE family protein|nr:patatin-like phospholipase family protein [Clostridia bacterium]
MGFFDYFKPNKNVSKTKIKLGLALSGGATRGCAHIGAIRAFEENGIDFDFIAGTSAGSLVGAFYCAGLDSNKMEEALKQIKSSEIKNSKLFFMPSKTEGIEALITKNLGDILFSDLKKPFCAVSVDLKTGHEARLTSGNLAKAVAGSCAVPGFFNPVEYDDMILVDGGLTNTIPSDVPRQFGCDYVVAVDVNRTRGYGTESTKLIDVMSASIRIMTKANAQKGIAGADILIQPNLQKYKSTKLDCFKEMISEGYNETLKVIPEIKKLMGIVDHNITEPKHMSLKLLRKQKKQKKLKDLLKK